MPKSPDAFRTISEVADWLGIQAHVLRFWESKFTQIKPVKRAGGRRYYRPADMQLIGGIKKLLHDDGLSIKDVQNILKDQGVAHVSALSQPLDDAAEEEPQTTAPSPSSQAVGSAAAAPGGDADGTDGEEADDDAPLPDSADVLSTLNAGPGEDEDETEDTGSPEASAPPEAEPEPQAETAAPEAEDQPLQAQLDLSPPEPALEPEAEVEPAEEAAPETLVDDILAAAAPDSPDAEHLTAPAPELPEPAPAEPEPAVEAALETAAEAEPAAEAEGNGAAGMPEPSGNGALLLENPAGLPGETTGETTGGLQLPPGSQLLSRLPRVSRIPAPVRAEVEACAAELRAWLDRR